MGGNASKPNLNQALIPQTEAPIVAVNKRFCSLETTKLRFTNHLGHNDFQVRDLDPPTKQRFQVSEHIPSIHDRKTVYDENYLPLVTLRRHNAHATVIADTTTTKKDLFTIESRGDSLFIDMSTRLTDPESGATHRLEIAGFWNPRKVLVWLVRGFERIPVGRIVKDGHYFDLEVAPGVDVALILLFCVVLHDKTSDSSGVLVHLFS